MQGQQVSGAPLEERSYMRMPDGGRPNHGRHSTWYPDGAPRSVRSYHLGEPVGAWWSWWQNGALRSATTFDPERPTRMTWWHANGFVSSEGLARAGGPHRALERLAREREPRERRGIRRRPTLRRVGPLRRGRSLVRAGPIHQRQARREVGVRVSPRLLTRRTEPSNRICPRGRRGPATPGASDARGQRRPRPATPGASNTPRGAMRWRALLRGERLFGVDGARPRSPRRSSRVARGWPAGAGAPRRSAASRLRAPRLRPEEAASAHRAEARVGPHGRSVCAAVQQGAELPLALLGLVAQLSDPEGHGGGRDGREAGALHRDAPRRELALQVRAQGLVEADAGPELFDRRRPQDPPGPRG